MPHSNVTRIKHRRKDEDLHTTRLVGAGWTWECGCGAKGAWSNTRTEATAAAMWHKMEKHDG